MDRQTQAFGLIANRSLGAQAVSLKQIRDTRSFETLNPNWEQFCERKAGISRSNAAKLIERLEEFGVNYSNFPRSRTSLPSLLRSRPAISDEGIEIEGEIVALEADGALICMWHGREDSMDC